MSELAYHRPKTLADAWRIRDECADARYIAGGTDLMVLLRAGSVRPDALISLRGIEELHGIEVDPGGGARIGALVTIRDILTHPALGEMYPVLREAARPFGSMQVRNLASVGGNLCNASPCAGMAPPLLVLEARVRLAGPGGSREMPLEEFVTGAGETRLRPGEVFTAVLLDPPPPGARSGFLKKGRVHVDLAIASVAALLVLNGDRCARARIAAGAVAPRPVRLRSAEKRLEGHRLEPARIAEARARAEREVSPITDVRASAEYRRHLTGALLQRVVESIREGR